MPNPFAKPTVDSIVADFQKKVDQLREVETEQLKKASVLQEEIDRKEAERVAATREANRASAVAARIKALVG